MGIRGREQFGRRYFSIHNVSWLWFGGGGGFGLKAGGEAEYKDEEEAGYGADCTEYTGTLKAAEEATDNRSGQRGGASYEVPDLDSKEAQRDDENSGKGAGQQAGGGNRRRLNAGPRWNHRL